MDNSELNNNNANNNVDNITDVNVNPSVDNQGASPEGGITKTDEFLKSVEANSNGTTEEPYMGFEAEDRVKAERIKAREEEKKRRLEEIEKNYKAPSKYMSFLLFMLFVFLIGFVVFLPEINKVVESYKAGKNNTSDELTSGHLVCTNFTNTANLNIDYKRTFKYIDKKLVSADYDIVTRGNADEDEATLDLANEKCKNLKEAVKKIKGVTITCEYKTGLLTEKQSYTFSEFDPSALNAAFAEAGGTYTEFSDGQNIDNIEKTMIIAGYDCMKEK